MIKADPKHSMNRQGLPNSPFFAMRKNKVKFPTIRKTWLTDKSVEAIKKHVTGKGRSILFLDGMYNTNLNRYVGKEPEERAVFFEYMVKHPKASGAIFLLSWIGNFHNGCIFHCAYQYPQVQCWREADPNAEQFLEQKAFQLYSEIAYILYSNMDDGEMQVDEEVAEFIVNGKSHAPSR